MRNIILFIKKYFTFFLFVLLEVLSISFLIRYNDSYAAVYSNVFNEYVGKIQRNYNDLQYFFDLKKTNKILVEENARLKDRLHKTLYLTDTLNTDSTRVLTDSLVRDTSGRRFYQQFAYIPAKVVNNSVTNENNYITVQRGSDDGIAADMAVVCPTGIVGKVVSVSKNFAIVMGLLNHNSKVSAMFLKNNYTGYVEWNGKSPDFVQFRNIPKTLDVKPGDTVVTSNASGSFPAGVVIGRIHSVKRDPATSFHQLEVKTGANFRTLQYVYIIKNQLFKEQRMLEDAQRLKDLHAAGAQQKR